MVVVTVVLIAVANSLFGADVLWGVRVVTAVSVDATGFDVLEL